MTTWYIERIPAAGGTPDIRTLDGWGIDGGTFTEATWALGSVSVSIPSNTAGSTAPAWGHLDHLILWAGNPASGGTRRQHLWVLLPGHRAEPQSEAHQYTLVGPWYWLEVTQFFYPLTVSDITTDPETGAATGCTWTMRHGTEVVWTDWAAQSSGTVQGQIHRALWCAIDNDAPIAIGAIDISGLAPVADQDGMTCADVIARAARYSPRASQWWDPSGATPIFRAASYAARPATSIALGPTSSAWDIAPRHDLRIDVVRVGYQWDNDGATAAWYDIVGDDTLKDGAHTLRSLVDCPDSATAANAASHYGIANQLYTALHSTPYTGGASWPDWGSGLPAVHTGHALNLTGALTEWATMLAPIASVTLTIATEAEDELSVSLGLPDSLGANDLFQLFTVGSRLGAGAVATTGGTTDPTPDPGGEDPNPGTYDDLNGGTGGGTPEGIVAVQARGGSWSYCGYAPYDGVEDSPPLRYRTETPSGTVVRRDYDNLWTTLLATRTDTPIGPRTWVGCTEPTASLWQRVQTAGGYCEASTTGVDEPPSTAAAVAVGHLVRSCTNTCGLLGNGYGCCGNAMATCGVEYCGNASRTLSNPDTPDAAIARLLAGSPEWGSSPNTAIRTVAATGITGLYREARYRTEHTAGDPAVTTPTLIGLVPWQRYQLTVTLESRPVDEAGTPTGDWAESGTRTHYILADITGEGGIDWQVVEPTAGYETRIASTLVEAA